MMALRLESLRRTRKIGCFSANFSIPFLMMLQLNVMIPAYALSSDPRFTIDPSLFSYHLNRSAERHLQRNDFSAKTHSNLGWQTTYLSLQNRGLAQRGTRAQDVTSLTSPCEKCKSPTDRFAPLTNTGK